MSEAPELPHRVEIAELRGVVERGAKAQVHTLRIQAALRVLSGIEAQRRVRPDLEWSVPGDGLVEEVAGYWHFELPAADVADPLAARRLALRTLESAVAPSLAGVGAANTRLLELIEQQKLALGEPRFHDVVHELKELGQQWTSRNAELEPLEQRLSALGPAVEAIGDALDRLDLALAGDDAHAMLLATRLGSGLIEALADLLERFELADDLPAVPEGDAREDAVVLREGFERLGGVLHAHVEEQRLLAEACAAECAALQAKVYAITG